MQTEVIGYQCGSTYSVAVVNGRMSGSNETKHGEHDQDCIAPLQDYSLAFHWSK